MKIIPTYSWNKNIHKMKLSRVSFMEQPWASGVTLLLCVIVAMLLANLPFTKELYHAILETDLSMSIQSPIDPETGMRMRCAT